VKIIAPTLHGVLDYTTVVLFAAAPSVLGLTGLAAGIAYALAGIHLLMTLVTALPLSPIKMLPLFFHGWVERVVGPVVIILPFVLGLKGVARTFYIAIGIVIVLVGILSDYESSKQQVRAEMR
jgi:hypothetical protein